MNLLLLLSALLAALTGVGGSARPPQASSIVAQQVRAAVLPSAAARVAPRPEQVSPSLADVAAVTQAIVVEIEPAVPLYATRLRE